MIVTSSARNSDEAPRRPLATTPEGRENQLIAAAYDLAEDQIRKGTASAQVVSHFLKMGSTTERLNREKTQREIAMADARMEEMKAQARIEELYSGAMAALRGYQGKDTEVEEEPDY